MDEPTTTDAARPEATEPADVALYQKVHRDLTTLTAVVDQLKTAQKNGDATTLVIAFAFGILAGIVALQYRKLNGLADALDALPS